MLKHYQNDTTRRYYTAHLVQDLFGDWVLVKAWGSLDSGRGQVRQSRAANIEDGQAQLAALDARRRQRDYRRVE